MRRSVLSWIVLLALVSGACSKSGDSSTPPHERDAAGLDADATLDARARDAMDADTADDGTTDGGSDCDITACGPHERQLSDCTCRSKFDRVCLTQADCRAGEQCRAFDGYSVCWLDPPPLAACPGSEGCPGNDGPLLAAAVSKSVTPLGFETPTALGLDEETMLRDPYRQFVPEEWNDCGLDGICPDDPDYRGPDDGEGDGQPQAVWIAGFSAGRPAQYCPDELVGCDRPQCCISKFAHDDIEVNLVVLRQGDTTVAFAALDTVGFFHTDAQRIQETVRARSDVDLLVMGATHNHEGPDTSGQWGPGKPAPTTTGRTSSFMQRVEDQTVAGIAEAVAALEPVDVHATIVDAGVDGLAIGDSRAPYIFDDNLPIVRFQSQATGAAVATMFSFGNHAEVRWSGNVLLTSDYFGYARRYVREGLPSTPNIETGTDNPALPGFGGVVVAFAGAVGGLIYPGRGGAKDYGQNPYEDEREHSWEATDAVGQQLAARVLAAPLTPVTSPKLRFATKQFLVPAQNRQLQAAAFALNVLERDVYNVSPVGLSNFRPDGYPYVLTQVAVVRLGTVDFFTAPGEMFPEMLVGGFPGKPRVQTPIVGDVREVHTPANCDADGLPTPDNSGSSACIITPEAENPPDWSLAPDGPYGYELVDGDLPFFIGVGMDFLGYMVPTYDFEEVGYFQQAPGDHYEETNGIGPTIMQQWRDEISECVDAIR